MFKKVEWNKPFQNFLIVCGIYWKFSKKFWRPRQVVFLKRYRFNKNFLQFSQPAPICHKIYPSFPTFLQNCSYFSFEKLVTFRVELCDIIQSQYLIYLNGVPSRRFFYLVCKIKNLRHIEPHKFSFVLITNRVTFRICARQKLAYIVLRILINP